MPARLAGVDVVALHSALNEIAHGIPTTGIRAAVHPRRAEIAALLERTTAALDGATGEQSAGLELEPESASLGAEAIDAAIAAIEPWEFPIRTGVSIDEAAAAANRLRAL